MFSLCADSSIPVITWQFYLRYKLFYFLQAVNLHSPASASHSCTMDLYSVFFTAKPQIRKRVVYTLRILTPLCLSG